MTSPSEPSFDDPEGERLAALLERVAAGTVTDAEKEELGLYDVADLPARFRQMQVHGQLSEGWLQRLEGDRQMKLVERSAFTRVERTIGAALTVGGFALAFVAPVVGSGVMAAGLVALTVSFVRTKLLTLFRDPYRDIER